MTEDEIFELAESLGLDRARLKLYEPVNWQWGRRYMMEYLAKDGQCHDYHFIVSRDALSDGLESYVVKCLVEDGLMELATKAGQLR